jgi:predicted house-cleaning noncanonical NTP pyrophosphatase (MazG superfamily)
MKRVYYRKLIRDRIPEKIRRDNGAECETRVLGAREFEKELIRKVAEEAGGMMAAKSRNELIEELADTMAVIDEVKRLKKISQSELRRAMAANFKKKGGFKKRLFLLWSSDTGYRTNERKPKSPKR